MKYLYENHFTVLDKVARWKKLDLKRRKNNKNRVGATTSFFFRAINFLKIFYSVTSKTLKISTWNGC